MTHNEIEMWALRVIEQVKNGQPHEDARVELKAKWPESHYKAARQIASHANPAGGEPILWLIGVDQTSGVVGADHKEMANWYKQVEAYFDEGIAPGVTDLNIPVDGRTVVALLFNTERRPFVVKTQNGGSISHEVPWRGATSTRSAKRSELLGMLSRIPRLPKWEPVNGTLNTEPLTRPRMRGNVRLWRIWLKLYVIPEGTERLSIPFHRCSGLLDFPAAGSNPKFRSFILSPYDQQSMNIKGSNTDLVVDGPGMVILEASAESAYGGMFPHIDGHVTINLPVAGGQYEVPVHATFSFNNENNRWEFGDLSEESSGVFFGS
jgi:hypothetical protein